MRFAATVYSKVLAEFLTSRVGIVGRLKNCDKTAARSDPQASLLLAADGLQAAETNVAGMERKVLSAAKPCSVMQAK